jgi:ADP-ribose pyrophosphatase YjhB (NUDIX family)
LLINHFIALNYELITLNPFPQTFEQNTQLYLLAICLATRSREQANPTQTPIFIAYMPKRKQRITHIVSLILRVDDNFLLLRKPIKRGGKYSLIGGRVEPNEAVISALIRETLEEAAIRIKAKHLRLVHVIHRRRESQDFFHFFFLCQLWQGILRNRELNKCEYLKWYPIDELPFEQMMPAIRCGIQAHLANESYSELGWQIK